jgi:hypothetical protein
MENSSLSPRYEFHDRYIPPGILPYVVAYDGPKKMQTAQAWIRRAEKQLRVKNSCLRRNPGPHSPRFRFANSGLAPATFFWKLATTPPSIFDKTISLCLRFRV